MDFGATALSRLASIQWHRPSDSRRQIEAMTGRVVRRGRWVVSAGEWKAVGWDPRQRNHPGLAYMVSLRTAKWEKLARV